MRKFFQIIIFVLGTTVLQAQSQVNIGLLAIPSITNIHANHDLSPYESLFFFNYGIKAYINKEKFSYSTGLLHFTQGAQFQFEASTVDIPEGTGEFFDIYIRIKAIVIPLSVDYLFRLSDRTQLFAGLGFYPGYIYSQQMENTSIPENYQPDPFFTPVYPVQRFTGVDIFNNFYLGINTGIGVKQLIGNSFNFKLRPNVLYQVRKNLPKEKHAWTSRLLSYSLDFGIYYNLGSVNKE